MRIRFLVLSLLVLCLAVSGCQQPQEPAVKVGVVDMNRLLRDSEPGKEASRFLEGMQKEIQQQIDDVQARLGKDPENEALQRELQAIYMGGQQRINAEQQNVVSQLLDLTQRLVNNYRKANGLSVVLGTDVAVAYDPALDVTNALLDEMNKQKVNFVSVSNPQPEAPAAAEAPAAEAPALERMREDVRDESPADRQRHCEEAAILVSIDNLLSYPWIQERVAAHELSLHAWYFDMSQGSLLAYFPDSETFEPLVARCRQCGALDAACGCHAHGVQA